MEKRYNIISPDGIPIHQDRTYTNGEVLLEFSKWKKRFEIQGYYSSNSGRIPLNELDDYCEVVEVKLEKIN